MAPFGPLCSNFAPFEHHSLFSCEKYGILHLLVLLIEGDFVSGVKIYFPCTCGYSMPTFNLFYQNERMIFFTSAVHMKKGPTTSSLFTKLVHREIFQNGIFLGYYLHNYFNNTFLVQTSRTVKAHSVQQRVSCCACSSFRKHRVTQFP